MNQSPQFDKHFGNALPPAIIILVFIWLFYWADSLFLFQFYKLGVLPKSIEGLQGILFMPLVHSTENFNHIINNSVPIFLLTLFLFYMRYHDGPMEIVTGGPFQSGTLITEENGSELDLRPLVDRVTFEFQLEEPSRSRTVWLDVHENRLYVASS